MKWLKSEGFIVDAQTGEIICILNKSEDKLRDKIVEIAPEMFFAILSLVENLDNGKSTVKSAYNEFKEIFERVPPEILDNAKLQV